MSATLPATGLAAGHGDRMLFSGLDLVVAPGDVVGLIGANGAGKSTLLRLLAGLQTPEQGRVALSPPSATVGQLPQEPERRPGETVRDFLARRTGVARAQSAMDAAEVAGGLGLGAELNTPMAALSGGQAGLAALLLSRYDVLLLDEPTNDLNLDGLERFVGELRSPVVIVSHDREFLARTATRVMELDLAAGLLRRHAAARHARPPDARRGAHHPALGGGRRAGPPAVTPAPASRVRVTASAAGSALPSGRPACPPHSSAGVCR
jgi:ATPase subunit of ABC transporter with duplicated ATPase domains